MSLLPAFEHSRPTSLDEAIELLDGTALPYHGGTELLAVMRIGLLRPDRLVDLKAIPELRQIRADEGWLVVGGGATHREVAADDHVRRHAPLLSEVAEVVGNVRVRAAGTVAGNVCFAEPKSDLTTTLLALGASVTLRSSDGDRTVALGDFVLGAYVTDLQPGEILTRVSVPAGVVRSGVYRKFQTAERPIAGVAAVVSDSREPACQVVVGAVGERPVSFDAHDLDAFDPTSMADEIDVIPDLAGGVPYKRHVTAVTIRRAIDDLRRRESA